MIEIVQKDNPVLREIAKKVRETDIGSPKLSEIVKNMKDALATQHDGVAIAAPQIGVSLRIFIVSGKVLLNQDDSPGEDMVFINPVIKKLSRKKESMDEGCLSVRWKYGTVRRSTNASITAKDEKGRTFSYNASGLLAQIFQHETDHLDGVLFIDKAKNISDVDPKDIQQHDEN